MSASLLIFSLLVSAPPVCRGKAQFPYDPKQNKTPKARAVAEIRLAYRLLCPLVMKDGRCGVGDIFENPSIGNNALTFVSGLRQGKRTRALIVYSASFLNFLDEKYGPGASFGVLAHEIGHHLTASGNLRGEYDHPWDEELRADYFAGCAIAQAGQNVADLEVAFKALAKVASPTHPASPQRNEKAKQGYNQCRKVRAEADKRISKPGPFGLGAEELRDSGALCWRYQYRNIDRIRKVGPVAAERRWSNTFLTKDICEAARQNQDSMQFEFSSPCYCESSAK